MLAHFALEAVRDFFRASLPIQRTSERVRDVVTSRGKPRCGGIKGADNRPRRQQLIRALRGQHQVMVVFARTRPFDYHRACFRRRQEDDVPETAQPVAPTEPRKRTVTVLRELRVPVRRVRSLNDPACGDIPTTFKPGYVVTALDHLLGRQIIGAVPIVLNSSTPARPTGGAAHTPR